MHRNPRKNVKNDLPPDLFRGWIYEVRLIQKNMETTIIQSNKIQKRFVLIVTRGEAESMNSFKNKII